MSVYIPWTGQWWRCWGKHTTSKCNVGVPSVCHLKFQYKAKVFRLFTSLVIFDAPLTRSLSFWDLDVLTRLDSSIFIRTRSVFASHLQQKSIISAESLKEKSALKTDLWTSFRGDSRWKINWPTLSWRRSIRLNFAGQPIDLLPCSSLKLIQCNDVFKAADLPEG